VTTMTQTAPGPHISVSNQGDELTTGDERVEAAFAGESAPTAGPLEDNGQEPVEGYVAPTARLQEALALKLTQLRDIGEASFGPPAPVREIVHGADDRVRITTTNVYPWSAHASLLITAADDSMWTGTGWFIGPHTLATAGHVVFVTNSGVPERDGWVKRIEVIPGRDGSSEPFGSVLSTSFRSVVGWTESGDPNYDYGAIILPTDLGNRTGWLGFGVYSDADLLASVGNISGYPGDQPSGTQWYNARRVASVNARKVYYDIDTAGGQSGSAVYRIVSGQRYGIAIHAYGGAVTNSGTRISSPVFNNLRDWKA